MTMKTLLGIPFAAFLTLLPLAPNAAAYMPEPIGPTHQTFHCMDANGNMTSSTPPCGALETMVPDQPPGNPGPPSQTNKTTTRSNTQHN